MNKISKYFLRNEFKIFFILLSALLLISFLGQYSSACGKFDGRIQRHLIRIIIGISIAYIVYIIDFKFWSSFAYVFYLAILVILVIVDVLGTIKLGAQRWINLYFFSFQPSELMKLALILGLSRYYSLLSLSESKNFKNHISPIFLVLFPTFLIFKQPDFGTAVLLFGSGFGIIFVSRFPKRIFFIALALFSGLCPLGWFLLHDYQKNRILTFLNPDRDPLGAGYHILQSKIAIGSGYIFGRGFLCGIQGKLDFLPEKNTDFIFTTIVEEFGFIGGILIIVLFLFLVVYFLWTASEVRAKFSKFMCYGLGIMIFVHVFINIAMVIGLVPVVGIPLPFLSYGGSSMITFMISCGLVMSALDNNHAQRKTILVTKY
ncbi:MAG: rod shape-determining protein RodA [Holosporaceae bacterium]|nr:rod shape-determining protein RodA [Holosporaceae bacterium]